MEASRGWRWSASCEVDYHEPGAGSLRGWVPFLKSSPLISSFTVYRFSTTVGILPSKEPGQFSAYEHTVSALGTYFHTMLPLEHGIL